MLPLIVKIIGSLFLAITILAIAQKSLESKRKITFITFLIIIVLSLPSVILFRTEYNIFISLITYILSILIFKKYFKISLLSSIYICSYGMILVAVMDIIVSTINSLFLTYEELRTSETVVIINNVLICCLAYFISTIPKIKNKINYLYKRIEKSPNYNIITFTIICILTIIITFFNITEIFKLNIYYLITISSIFVLFLLYYFYISELNNYEKLNDKYNILFDYVQTFEDWIDNEQLYRHELKNNLSMIRNMTNNKKLINKIDDMLNMNINIDDEYVEILKYIPKGGLKGLLYYKIALAKSKNVNMVIEISNKVTTEMKKITENKLRQIGIIIGIYLDNAIEAAELSKKKQITLEIYEINSDIVFVISNTYNKMLPIKYMNKKGYTTKGENHGKGLYYVSKILRKYKWLESSQIYINDFFIQKLCIK